MFVITCVGLQISEQNRLITRINKGEVKPNE